MAEMSKESQEKINQLQQLEQSLQSILMQKQQFQNQIIEIDSALGELDSTEEAYKIVGNVMVHAEKPKLKEDLESKKERLELRIKAIEKQETDLKTRATSLQEEVLKHLRQ